MKKGSAGAPGLVPAAARAHAPRKADRDVAQASIDAFVAAIGGRTRLVEMLSVGASDPQIEEVLSLLSDPAANNLALGTICRQAHLSVADFFTAFSKASLIRGELVARVKVEADLGKVIDDLLLQAQPHEEECEACQGQGFKPPPDPTPSNPNPNPIPCKECYARGRRKVKGDLERQRLILDLARLLPQKGGPAVQVNTQVNNNNGQRPAGAGHLEQLQQLVTEALYSGPPVLTTADLRPTRPPVQDAEVLP